MLLRGATPTRALWSLWPRQVRAPTVLLLIPLELQHSGRVLSLHTATTSWTPAPLAAPMESLPSLQILQSDRSPPAGCLCTLQ